MKKKTMAGVLCLVATACGPPTPVGPSYSLVTSYIAPVRSFNVTAVHTVVDGIITNTGSNPADYNVRLVSSSGETVTARALDVLAGQTAAWQALFVGDVTVASAGVTASLKTAGAVPAVAGITSQEASQFVDAGTGTLVRGTLTNTGSTAATFTVELLANTGAVSISLVQDVQPGQTAQWQAFFVPPVYAHIVRVTNGAPRS